MGPDATAFEYAMGLFSVLIGLAIIDVATSFHRLMRNRHTVHWDALTLGSAIYALCTAIYMWFDLWGVRHFQATRQFLFYLGLVAEFFVMFLAAAASLPDEADESTDLRLYYNKNRRYFWSLMATFQFGYFAFGLYFAGGDSENLSRLVLVLSYVIMTAPLIVSLALIVLKSRAAHWVGLSICSA